MLHSHCKSQVRFPSVSPFSNTIMRSIRGSSRGTPPAHRTLAKVSVFVDAALRLKLNLEHPYKCKECLNLQAHGIGREHYIEPRSFPRLGLRITYTISTPHYTKGCYESTYDREVSTFCIHLMANRESLNEWCA